MVCGVVLGGEDLGCPPHAQFLGEKRITQAFKVGARWGWGGVGGVGGEEAAGCGAGVQSWDFNSTSTAARACLRDRAASCAVNYTPPMGLLGSRALMCWKAF